MSLPRLSDQARFWNDWNREKGTRGEVSALTARKCAAVLRMLESLPLAGPEILEVGCGTGWMADRLSRYGKVTAMDLADEAVRKAGAEYPHIRFLAGDALTLELPERGYDLIVTLETVTHVEDQPAFFARLASLLKPGGHLIVTCQNRFVFQRRRDVMAQGAGQIRRWLTMGELKGLLRPRFRVLAAATVAPAGDTGILRIVNSAKLGMLLRLVWSERSLEGFKERLGFGQTLAVLAQVRG